MNDFVFKFSNAQLQNRIKMKVISKTQPPKKFEMNTKVETKTFPMEKIQDHEWSINPITGKGYNSGYINNDTIRGIGAANYMTNPVTVAFNTASSADTMKEKFPDNRKKYVLTTFVSKENNKLRDSLDGFQRKVSDAIYEKCKDTRTIGKTKDDLYDNFEDTIRQPAEKVDKEGNVIDTSSYQDTISFKLKFDPRIYDPEIGPVTFNTVFVAIKEVNGTKKFEKLKEDVTSNNIDSIIPRGSSVCVKFRPSMYSYKTAAKDKVVRCNLVADTVLILSVPSTQTEESFEFEGVNLDDYTPYTEKGESETKQETSENENKSETADDLSKEFEADPSLLDDFDGPP